ncbi:hypothetical protein LTR09_003879 [Extremus antarcticus]|uniref:Uncharacterized protein n=1 Tax=Extremus antarcticus TaxID=702011 RepID=A0AAJ0DS98_9PEZI|nr:hypothetical protein LTR09_003879 [Extremus antarcticus]
MACLAASRRNWPSIRSTSRQMLSSRKFSASSRSQGALTEFAIAGPNAIIDGLHSTGLPYYAVLPLTAVLVRSTLVYYLATKPARTQAQLVTHQTPLVQARTRMLMTSTAELVRQNNHLAKLARSKRRDVEQSTRWHQYASKFRLTYLSKWRYGRVFGTNVPYGLLNFGFLILFAESIRMKCGRSEGLLSMVLTPFEKIGRLISAHFQPSTKPGTGAQVQDPAELLAARLQAAWDEKMAQAKDGELVDLTGAPISPEEAFSALDPHMLEPLSRIDTASPYFDAALQSEGLSWCTNLTATDPTWMLPVMASTVLISSVLYRPSGYKTPKKPIPLNMKDHDTEDKPSEPKSILLKLAEKRKDYTENLSGTQKISLAGAYLFSIATFNLPAAVLLYLIPSVAIGWLQNRPLRFRAKQEWSD